MSQPSGCASDATRPFPSAWSGDRVCTLCRTNEDSQDKQAIKRGQTSRTYDSPFEPDYTPGVVMERVGYPRSDMRALRRLHRQKAARLRSACPHVDVQADDIGACEFPFQRDIVRHALSMGSSPCSKIAGWARRSSHSNGRGTCTPVPASRSSCSPRSLSARRWLATRPSSTFRSALPHARRHGSGACRDHQLRDAPPLRSGGIRRNRA